jgi:hypothetical protein
MPEGEAIAPSGVTCNESSNMHYSYFSITCVSHVPFNLQYAINYMFQYSSRGLLQCTILPIVKFLFCQVHARKCFSNCIAMETSGMSLGLLTGRVVMGFMVLVVS